MPFGIARKNDNENKKSHSSPFDLQWNADFLKIKKELEGVLDGLYCSIEHVGSTFVEGLPAKPDVVMNPNASLKMIIMQLSLIGYHHEGNLGIEGREAFKYSGKTHLREHHLYVCPHDSLELKRHLAFRHYLREHPEAREAYGKVKLEAAKLFPDDIESYIDYKTPCIEAIYKQCRLMTS